MTPRKILSLLPVTLLWVPLIFFSLLLSHNAMLYFTHGGEYGILPEKRVAQQDIVWLTAFYVHLPAGVFCLLSPFFLFTRRFFKGALPLHKTIGKLYVWITLFIVCPTGMYLALYAKGGFITQVGFMLQGVLLAVFTYRGQQAIRGGDKVEHFHAMIRSYAVATVVLTFRIYHIVFFLLNVPYQDNYAISQWLGLFGNMLLAELIILFTLQSKKINTLKSLPL
ncbi:DUF2306 domain-containing protein [Chryseolinea lacunae]|uniref:DUF2306 domain-containing protein n=1 Tax=Chryseolinea lacunae TaxID=2801331 RepID=A0ABS1KK39_9BACT|nr:DUF2306 domain-containing protein [Chryseolinea lacunae]MBL0739815.1 DUF2306 domain-containing protein [Chryseolinea lacunae]